jgi:hypothetical protein
MLRLLVNLIGFSILYFRRIGREVRMPGMACLRAPPKRKQNKGNRTHASSNKRTRTAKLFRQLTNMYENSRRFQGEDFQHDVTDSTYGVKLSVESIECRYR